MDRTKYAEVMLVLQKKEEQRIKSLTSNKGKGKIAIGIEDFTLKTMLGKGGFGKVQKHFMITAKSSHSRSYLPRGGAQVNCAQSRL